MQPLTLDPAVVAEWISRLWWPVLRIGGFVLAAPAVSEVTVPPMVKIAFTLGLAFLVAPLAQVPAGLSIFSGPGAVAAVQEVLIGAAIAMIVQLAFEALNVAGQTVSATMGLGFATLIDPRHGEQTEVLGQLYMTVGLLTYLSLNGHLMLLAAFVHSFQTLPVGGGYIDGYFALAVARWGAALFETGILVALPAVIALVIVNIALGVVSRAAPQLNLFGIGFTISLSVGIFVLLIGTDSVLHSVRSLLDAALQAAAVLVDAPATQVR